MLCPVQVFEGSAPVRVCVETSLPRVFEMEAESVSDALGWRESLGAAMNRYDTANKAMAAKHAGDVSHGALLTSRLAVLPQGLSVFDLACTLMAHACPLPPLNEHVAGVARVFDRHGGASARDCGEEVSSSSVPAPCYLLLSCI